MAVDHAQISLWKRLLWAPVGAIFLLVAILGLHFIPASMIDTWSFINGVCGILLCITYLFIGTALFLAPFIGYRAVSNTAKLLLIPAEKLLDLGYYHASIFAPFMALYFLFGSTHILVSALQPSALMDRINERAIIYLSLTIASLVFIYLGRKLVPLFTKLYGNNWDFNKLYALLNPQLLRPWVYGIILITYVIANFEKFGEVTVITSPGWLLYRDVLVEVLLTVGAADAFIVLMHEYWSKQGQMNDLQQ